MKQKKTKNKIKLFTAIALIAILSLGGTMAYMTDYEAAKNKFTVGKVDFNLYESKWDGELPDGSYATPSDATPSDASPSNALASNRPRTCMQGWRFPKTRPSKTTVKMTPT